MLVQFKSSIRNVLCKLQMTGEIKSSFWELNTIWCHPMCFEMKGKYTLIYLITTSILSRILTGRPCYTICSTWLNTTGWHTQISREITIYMWNPICHQTNQIVFFYGLPSLPGSSLRLVLRYNISNLGIPYIS